MNPLKSGKALAGGPKASKQTSKSNKSTKWSRYSNLKEQKLWSLTQSGII